MIIRMIFRFFNQGGIYLFNFIELFAVWTLKYCIWGYLTLGNILSDNVVTSTANIINVACSCYKWFNFASIILLLVYWSCRFLRLWYNPTVNSRHLFFSSLYFQHITYLVFLLSFLEYAVSKVHYRRQNCYRLNPLTNLS